MSRDLAESRGPLADILLLHLLEDQDEFGRLAAVEALEQRGGVLARIGLRAALGDPSHFVREEATEALGRLGNRRDVPWLLIALDDPEWRVRCSAAASLGRLGGPRARRALQGTLTEDPEPAVRMWASGALGDLDDPAVVPWLEQALTNEQDHWVGKALIRVLYWFGHRPLEQYLACLHDDDYMVRFQTLGSIRGEVRPEDQEAVLAALRQLLEREELPGVQGNAEAALQRLLKRGNHATSSVTI